MNGAEKDKWIEAAVEEITSLRKNHTWVLVDSPKNQKAIGCRWIFIRKPGMLGVEDPRYVGVKISHDGIDA